MTGDTGRTRTFACMGGHHDGCGGVVRIDSSPCRCLCHTESICRYCGESKRELLQAADARMVAGTPEIVATRCEAAAAVGSFPFHAWTVDR